MLFGTWASPAMFECPKWMKTMALSLGTKVPLMVIPTPGGEAGGTALGAASTPAGRGAASTTTGAPPPPVVGVVPPVPPSPLGVGVAPPVAPGVGVDTGGGPTDGGSLRRCSCRPQALANIPTAAARHAAERLATNTLSWGRESCRADFM